MRYFILSLLSVLFIGSSSAQNWTGQTSSDWNDPSNWSSWPLNGQDIIINPSLYSVAGGFHPVVSSNSVFTPALITLQNGAVLTISANLSTDDDVEVFDLNSEIIVTNGVFSVNPGGGGRLIIDLESSMTVNGGTVNVDERLIAGQDAVITINGGTVTSGERLLMDLGGQFVQNGGSVSVAQTFAMADGSTVTSNNSSYILNNGTLQVTGEMAFENEAGNYMPFYEQNGGSLTVNGTVMWFGAAPGLGRPKMIINGGDVTINGLVENMVGSTVEAHLEINGASTQFTLNGPGLNFITPLDSLKQTDGSSLVINSTNTVNNEGVWFITGASTEFNGLSTLNGTGIYQFDTLLISASGAINQLSAPEVAISGSFQKLGGYTVNGNQMKWNGSIQQEVSGNGILSLNDLIIDNGSVDGVELLLPAEISGDLQLIDGILTTSSMSILTVKDNATATGGNSMSFVNGPMIKEGDDAFVFPVGKGTRWRRIAMSAPAVTSEAYQAEYFDQSAANITSFNTPLTSVSNIEYWNLESISGSTPLNVELFWEDAAASGITDCGEVTIAQWGGSVWENEYANASGVCTGNGVGSLTSINALPAPGLLTYGFFSGVTTQNLTICQGDSVNVGTNYYSSTGTYIDHLQDVSMNDSTVITNLTVHPVDQISQSLSICEGESIMVGPFEHHLAGLYHDTLQNAFGCDSIVTTQLAVNTVDISYDVQGVSIVSLSTTASGYRWLDCQNDSIAISGEVLSTFTPMNDGSYAMEVTASGCVDTTECITIVGTGIEEETGTWNIYPNPIADGFTISTDQAMDLTIVISDITGKQVLRKEVGLTNGLYVPFKEQSGIYFIDLYDGNELLIRERLIKE